jgi:hypothetical protein
MNKSYYVYCHKRKTDDTIFYIGKGCGDRCIQKKNRNNHWRNIAKKNGFYHEIIKDGLSEQEAFDFEVEAIAKIGLDNLANMTAGGEGTSGRPMPESTILYTKSKENRERVSRQWKGVVRGEEFSAKLSIALKGKKFSEERRHSQRIGHKSEMKVVICECNGMEFDSVYYANEWLKSIGKATKSAQAQIRHVCKGRSKTACGFKWRYK